MARPPRPLRSRPPALLKASDIVDHYPGSMLTPFFFLIVFIFTIPIVHILPLPPSTEMMVLCALLAACHIMNWPMLSLRWRLWFRGRLSVRAALLITVMLMGTFGFPFYILFKSLTAG